MHGFKDLNAEANLEQSTNSSGFEPMTAQLEHFHSQILGEAAQRKNQNKSKKIKAQIQETLEWGGAVSSGRNLHQRPHLLGLGSSICLLGKP